MKDLKIYKEYVKLLERKIENRTKVNPESKLNEDEMRYLFFHVFVKTKNLNPVEINLEENHYELKGAKIDMCAYCKGENYYFEFKYHRKMPKAHSDKTYRSASIFKDILRLNSQARKGKCNALLIYLTEPEMINYFKHKKNGFNQFSDLPLYSKYTLTKEFIEKRSKSFRKIIGSKLYNPNNYQSVTIQLLYQKTLTSNNTLYIYRVD